MAFLDIFWQNNKFDHWFLMKRKMKIQLVFWVEQTSLKNFSSQIFPHFGENSRKLSVHTEKRRHVSSFQYRERLQQQADHWSPNCRGVFTHYHVEITWSFDGDCVFTKRNWYILYIYCIDIAHGTHLCSNNCKIFIVNEKPQAD